MCYLHLNQQRFSVRLNLFTNGGALADPENVRMAAPQFEPRKKVANFCVRLRASRIQLMRCYVILLEYRFPGKVGSDLGEETPIASIRWTTQFVGVRRISDLYNPT